MIERARRTTFSIVPALALVSSAALAGCADRPPAPPSATKPPSPRLPVTLVASYPHDRSAFIQGLVWAGSGRLYESTGLEGRSSLREVELATGKVLRKTDLDARLFGEGLALVGDRLIQLTWKDGRALLWDRVTFATRGEWSYTGEGWGLAFDGESLLQSDGSAVLTFRSPADFSSRRTLLVRRDGQPLFNLNELEWADGSIFANVWTTDEIVRIDPATGAVTATYDASGLLSPEDRQSADVLNGIAFDPESKLFFVTGKLWPRLFAVRLPKPPPGS